MLSASLYDNVLACAYLAVWVLTFVCYHRKIRTFDNGSAIIACHIVYGITSVMTLNDEIFSMSYEPLTLFPYIYLYAMLMLALVPIIVFRKNTELRTIEPPNTCVIKLVAWMMIVVGIAQLPFLLRDTSVSLAQLLTDSDAGMDAYQEGSESAATGGSAVSNLFSIVYNAFYDLSIFIFFYLLTLPKRRWLFMVVFLGAIGIGLVVPALKGQRTGVITGLQALLVGYLLFKQFMSQRLTRAINIAGLTLMLAVMMPVVAITFSRFSDRGVTRYLSWYEWHENHYFNNHALDAGGIRYGDRTINIFKRLVVPDTPNNYEERREKYHNLDIDDYYFTTFVGDFALDFGPIGAVLIFIVFYAWATAQSRPRGKTVRLEQLLIIYFVACVSMQGGMYLFAYSDTGNLKIIITFLFYAYLCYHRKLLERYPLKNNATE